MFDFRKNDGHGGGGQWMKEEPRKSPWGHTNEHTTNNHSGDRRVVQQRQREEHKDINPDCPFKLFCPVTRFWSILEREAKTGVDLDPNSPAGLTVIERHITPKRDVLAQIGTSIMFVLVILVLLLFVPFPLFTYVKDNDGAFYAIYSLSIILMTLSIYIPDMAIALARQFAYGENKTALYKSFSTGWGTYADGINLLVLALLISTAVVANIYSEDIAIWTNNSIFSFTSREYIEDAFTSAAHLIYMFCISHFVIQFAYNIVISKKVNEKMREHIEYDRERLDQDVASGVKRIFEE